MRSILYALVERLTSPAKSAEFRRRSPGEKAARVRLYALVSLILAGCAQNSAGSYKDAKDLVRAKSCSVKATAAERGTTPAPSIMTLANNGGWCWGNIFTHVSDIASPSYGVNEIVTNDPTHGIVVIKVFDDGTRVAYQPQPGFVGEDTFTTMNEMHGIRRVWQVKVVK